MSETLYRKYRPLTFDSVVGQQHIVTTLQNAIKTGRLSHAYMFCGPRGTGKTTMARILAKACLCVNPGEGSEDKSLPTDSPCGKCQECSDIASGNHPDVYELDAASRTGVENVREEIIGRVNFAATRGKHKIYIIDEVHMLSIAAFNALLKTLEEPPSHVIFVLCTTDPQKVPETILSRCQRFDFRSISDEDIVSRLQFVCKSENVEADADALELVAKEAKGGMRNALTILEQMFSFAGSQINVDVVRKSLGASSSIDLSGLLNAISSSSLADAFAWIDQYASAGADFSKLTMDLCLWARNEYVAVACGKNQSNFSLDILHYILVELGELNTTLKTSVDKKLSFEICVAKMIRPNTKNEIDALSARVSKLEEGGVSVARDVKPTAPQANLQPAQSERATTAPVVSQPIQKATPPSTPVVSQPIQKATPPSTPVVSQPIQNETQIPSSKEPEQTEEIQSYNDEITTSSTEIDLTNEKNLSKVWHKAFASVKQKYPAYGAFLITATATYRQETNQVVLKFPTSAKFAADTISDSETSAKIAREISDSAGTEGGIDVELEDIAQEKFDPVPNLKPTEQQLEESREKNQNPLVSAEDMKEVLSSFGAQNITED